MDNEEKLQITKKQALELLKSFSAIEGYLFSIRNRSDLFDAFASPSVEVLTKIILGEKQ